MTKTMVYVEIAYGNNQMFTGYGASILEVKQQFIKAHGTNIPYKITWVYAFQL